VGGAVGAVELVGASLGFVVVGFAVGVEFVGGAVGLKVVGLPVKGDAVTMATVHRHASRVAFPHQASMLINAPEQHTSTHTHTHTHTHTLNVRSDKHTH